MSLRSLEQDNHRKDWINKGDVDMYSGLVSFDPDVWAQLIEDEKRYYSQEKRNCFYPIWQEYKGFHMENYTFCTKCNKKKEEHS